MIHTDRAIVVEGKYDKIKLSGMIDGVIVCTGGFRIYKDKEMQAMLRTLANKQGLAVLTDSDAAGFQIRGFIRNICGKEKIVDVYIPDLYGKENASSTPPRRESWEWKASPSSCCKKPLRRQASVCSRYSGQRSQSPRWICSSWDFPAQRTVRSAESS